jgi:hypothetical protein
VLKSSTLISVLALTCIGAAALFASSIRDINKTGPTAREGNQGKAHFDARKPDVNNWPSTNYNASENNPRKRAERQKRSKKYDKSDWRVHPADLSDSTVRVDAFDTSLPAFLVNKSDLVIIGEVVQGVAYLSDDKTGVYSEFTIRVEQLLQDCGNNSLNIGSHIDIQREGGRVRFNSGREHWYGIDGAGMPVPASRYLFFLRKLDTGVFDLVTGYELTGNTVQPLDNLSSSQVYRDSEQSTFLKTVPAKLSPCKTK